MPVTTERLLLRAFLLTDLDAVHALQSDPEIVRYIPWPLRTREQSRDWLAERIAADRLERDDDGVAWAVVRRSDDQLLGSINLWLRSVEHQQGEVGFVVSGEAQGQGYAREATAAVLDLAFRVVGLHRVYGTADGRNEASARLMTRLGMRQEARLREDELFKGEWVDSVVFAVLRDEWLARS